MKELLRFVGQFSAKINFNPELVLKKDNRYYLLNPELRRLAALDNVFYVGLYLGKVKNGKFFPSFNLLNLIAESAQNKVVLNRKAAWLFICGRDVFQKGIVKTFGSKKAGEAVLVLNEFGECLGFGRVTSGLGGADGKVAVENVLDVGDFLRREREG